MATNAIRGPGVGLTISPLMTNAKSLASGQAYIIPAGQYLIKTGGYTSVQYLDPVTNLWSTLLNSSDVAYVSSDGTNYRIVNLTGTMVGAVVTTAGSGYTSPPTVTASAGGSTWTAIVGGLVSTTVTVVTGGSNYTYAPHVTISAPPPGGIQATATATISSGAVSALTITNQGAGYVTAPTITLVTNPLDPNATSTTTPITVATATAALTGSGTIAAVVCTNPGSTVTSLPTLSFSGGGGSSAAATAIANFVVTAYAVTGGGTGFTAGTLVTTSGGLTSATPTHTNPIIEQGIITPRPAQIVAALSSGVITATGQIVVDNGFGFQTVPTAIPISANGLPTGGATLTASVGGVTDTFWIQPI